MTDLFKAIADERDAIAASPEVQALQRDRDCMKANADDAYEKWVAEHARAEAAEAENATLRAQLDATLKDRALIMAERDKGARDYCALMERHDAEFVRAEAAEITAAAMEAEAHAHIKLWGDALRQRDAAEARVRAEALEEGHVAGHKNAAETLRSFKATDGVLHQPTLDLASALLDSIAAAIRAGTEGGE